MNLLAVDTTDEVLSLAVSAPGRVPLQDAGRDRPFQYPGRGRVWSFDKKLAAHHDEALFAAAERLLKRAGLRLSDVGAFAAASGPGRFTGIRIGMTFCSVASSLLEVPAVAVSRLEALAFATEGRLVCAAIPGWKEERYCQVFERPAPPKAGLRGKRLSRGRARACVPKPVGPPWWVTVEEWPSVRSGLKEKGNVVAESRPGGREIAFAALARLESGRLPRFEPFYLKPAGYERRR